MKRREGRCWFCGTAVLILLGWMPLASLGASIEIRCSDSTVVLAQSWAEEYVQATMRFVLVDVQALTAGRWSQSFLQKRLRVPVNVSGSTSSGLLTPSALSRDVYFSTRQITAQESLRCQQLNGWQPQQLKVAMYARAIYVHPENPVTTLSLPQLQAIFTGQLTNWLGVGGPDAPIAVYCRDQYGGFTETDQLFTERVAQNEPIAKSVRELPGTSVVIQAVATNRAAIGYGALSTNQNVRALALRAGPGQSAILPSLITITNQTYPLCGHVFAYVAPTNNRPGLHGFVQMIRSPTGQAGVRGVGFYPWPGGD